MQRYNSWAQMTELNLGLIGNATCYTLTTSTKTVVIVPARALRAGGYIINLSSPGIRITPVNYGSIVAPGAREVKLNGMYVEGIDTPSSAAVSATQNERLNLNRFDLGEYTGAFYITLDDDAISTFTGSVAVYDYGK